METITFEVHPMTPTSPRNTLATKLMVEKHSLYRIQNIRSGKLTDLLHLQLITCTVQVSEFKNKKA